MDLDDLEPKNNPKPKKNLEVMSIDALKDYIDELESEISRVEAAITEKQSARADAESVFKR